jgi:hypothetical protein
VTDHGPPSDEFRADLGALVGALGKVTRDLRDAVRTIPGVRLIEAQAQAGEQFLWREIRRRLDELEPWPVAPDAGSRHLAPRSTNGQAASRARPPTIDETIRGLLARSMHHTPAESRRSLHELLVAEIVPDEARILSALSDGSVYPMVHIAEANKNRVLEYASSVGRAAGVALPGRVHFYVSHLRQLGLVEAGPEDRSLREEYDILLTDSLLMATIAAIGKGPRGARVIRATVRISDLGRELWEAAIPPEPVDDAD